MSRSSFIQAFTIHPWQVSAFPLLLLAFLYASSASAKQTVLKLGVVPIDGILHPQNSGPYNALLEALFEDTNTRVEYIYMPNKRIRKKLLAGSISCSFPDSLFREKSRIELVQSLPLNRVTAHLFFINNVAFNSLEEASHKIILYPQAYTFRNMLNEYPDVTFQPVDSASLALELMKKNKASAFMEYYPDLKLQLSKEEAAMLVPNRSQPLLSENDRILCRNSPQNRRFISLVNKHLKTFKKDGTLTHLLGAYSN